MTGSIQSKIENLRTSIRELEAQRGKLGDAVVETAISTLKKELSALEEQAATQAAPGEERRMVTILFTDMVGSTSMAEKMDPEEWRQLMQKLHAAIGQSVTSHHGSIAQYLGDGLLAFFGDKEASENDPENAIRAALDAQSAVAALLSDENIQLRAGIHTGLVVVGELGDASHREFTASGDAVNLAARLQSAAPPGGILISHDTYRYVRGVFDLTPRPPLMVKGKSEAVQTYLVRRAKPRPFRSVTRGVAGIETRTVGREEEMKALQQAYLQAYEGHGVVWAQLLGEPGVGKSRLLEDMNDWLELREETYRLLRARAFPDDANHPYALVRRLWFDRFQVAEDAPLKQAEEKWVERFKELSGFEEFEEPAHALGLLVGLPFLVSPHIKAMRNDPAQVKGRAMVVSRQVISSVRNQTPVVVFLEDLQWMDASSWEYLMETFLPMESDEYINGLFILGAARPEWQPPQALQELFTVPKEKEKSAVVLTLEPLSDQGIHELALEILQKVKDIPSQVVDLVVERSEGVPYFTEEMVNWFIDHGILDNHGDPWRFFPDKLKEQPLPATLQHLLLTRLGSLSQTERATLQRGAIFGRRFWSGGVEALGTSGSSRILPPLQPRGFVQEQPESSFLGDTEWSFHHNLLQEVTYESVLKRERAALHKEAASWLELQARQAGRLDEFAGLLGEHCQKAGELGAAADWYLQAGKCAMRQGAPREAVEFYTRALDLLPPVDKERRWQALLGREEGLGILGDADAWRPDVKALVDLAKSMGNDHYLAEAYLRQAIVDARAGSPKEGISAANEALEISRRCGNEAIEAKVHALFACAWADQGDKPAALQSIEESLKLANRLEDENLMAFVIFRVAYAYSSLADFASMLRYQKEQIELDHRLGNRSQEAIGLGNLGSTYIAIGMYKQGRTIIEQAIRINEDLGARRPLAYNIASLGEIFFNTGDMLNAKRMYEKALQEILPTQDERGKFLANEGLGLILMEMEDEVGAKGHFQAALDLARDHEMIPFFHEIKAYLAKLALSQGQLEEAGKNILETWNYMQEHGWIGISNPVLVFRYCAEVFEALGEKENEDKILQFGHAAIMEVADTINIPEGRQSFIENNPDVRAFIEIWERRKN